MRYVEFPAPSDIEPWVRCIWTFEGEFESAHDERIVPDGCPEIIIHFGSPYSEQDEAGFWREQPLFLLAGNLTRPLMLRAQGKVGVLGIRLWPHAVRHLAERPASALLDRRLPLDDALIAPFQSRLATCDDAARLLAASTIFKAVASWPAEPDPEAGTVKRIFACRGQVEPDALAKELGVSLRQLERRMKAACGMSVKLLASLVRFRCVFDELQADVPSPWLNAALAAGYFDQAHMIRDFKRFAGQPPSAFLPGAGALSTAIVSTPS